MKARIHLVQIEGLAIFVAPVRFAEVRAGVGLRLPILVGRAAVNEATPRTDTQLGLGGVVSGGIAHGVGPGAVFLDVTAGLAKYGSGLFEIPAADIAAALGYRWSPW